MQRLSINMIYDDNKASRILDLIRFLASIVVFLFHFYVPLPGYQAVMIFFVISGYFISSSVLKMISENRWNWGKYFLNRIIRLWIVLIPSLILTLFWAKIQFSLFGVTKISNFLSWKIFLGNLFFLQGIIVPEYGQNGPLWSLSYEFWYYVLFPCLVLLFYSSKKAVKVLYGILILLIISFVGLKITEYFFVWMIGACIPLLKPIKIKANIYRTWILMVSIILVLLSMRTYLLFEKYPMLQILPDLSIGVTSGILVYFIISFFNNVRGSNNVNIPKQLAGFSYTLYLVHFPLAHIILTWRESKQWSFTGVEALLMKFIIIISVVLFAWLIALLTEKHTNKVRKITFSLIKTLMNRKKRSQIIDKNVV